MKPSNLSEHVMKEILVDLLLAKVPNFEGVKGGSNTEDFISHMDALFSGVDFFSESDKVEKAVSKFSEDALEWLLLTYHSQHPIKISTWREMKKVLRAQFGSSSKEEDALLQLTQLRQGQNRVIELHYDMLLLFAKVPNLTLREKKVFLYNAMHPRYRKDFAESFQKEKTFEAWMEKLSQLERDHEKSHEVLSLENGKKVECRLCSKNHSDHECAPVRALIDTKLREKIKHLTQPTGGSSSTGQASTKPPAHTTGTHAASGAAAESGKRTTVSMEANLNSRCSQHIFNTSDTLTNLRDCQEIAVVPDILGDVRYIARQKGDFVGTLQGKPFTLNNVLYVPEINRSFVSIMRLCQDDFKVNMHAKNNGFTLSKDNGTFIKGKFVAAPCMLRLVTPRPEKQASATSDKKN